MYTEEGTSYLDSSSCRGAQCMHEVSDLKPLHPALTSTPLCTFKHPCRRENNCVHCSQTSRSVSVLCTAADRSDRSSEGTAVCRTPTPIHDRIQALLRGAPITPTPLKMNELKNEVRGGRDICWCMFWLSNHCGGVCVQVSECSGRMMNLMMDENINEDCQKSSSSSQVLETHKAVHICLCVSI